MAYKRTTKSTKLRNGGTIRRTNTINTKTGKQTNSWSSSNGTSTTTRNTKGETWLTINQSGWITKRKISGHAQKPAPKPKKSRARRKTQPMSRGTVVLSWIIIIGFFAWLLW
jgi:hypothetical protein